METTKVMYYEIEHEDYIEWALTTAVDEESVHYMKLYEGAVNFRIASYNDLLDWAAATGEIFENGLIEVKEGLVQFQYRPTLEPISKNVEVYGEYVELYNPDNIVA